MHALHWTAWLLILAAPAIGLALVLRFWSAHRHDDDEQEPQ